MKCEWGVEGVVFGVLGFLLWLSAAGVIRACRVTQ